MKRSRTGIPVGMTTVERWSRSTLSCQLCRSKKLRCDRSQPCSNCSSRNVSCEYASSPMSLPHDGGIQSKDNESNIDRNQELASQQETLTLLPERYSI